MASGKKDELFRFVEREAFGPFLRAKMDGRSDADKKTLARVQEATQAEVERYRGYDSAEELVTNFKRDLSSEAAKKVPAQLRSLHLPTIEDIRGCFERKARDLGVHAGP